MEHLNQSLFLLINAGPGASSVVVTTARLVADGLIWVVPAGLIIGWLWGSSSTRQLVVSATLSGIAGLLINQFIALLWYHPRPFELGLGHLWMHHARDSSFPSDHLTLIWAVAFNLMRHKDARLAGAALALAGLPVAWARIYLGVHFPLDMLGAGLVALSSAWLIFAGEHHLMAPLMRLLLPIHRTLFAGLIRRNWVRQ